MEAPFCHRAFALPVILFPQKTTWLAYLLHSNPCSNVTYRMRLYLTTLIKLHPLPWLIRLLPSSNTIAFHYRFRL